MNMCCTFPLLSTPHFLYRIWTDLKRSEKIPGAPMWRWGESIWLTRPSGLHRNSPKGLNITSIRVFDQIRSRDPNHPLPPIYIYIYIHTYHNVHDIVRVINMFQNAQWQKPIFQELISRDLFEIETRGQVFCIALGPVTICIVSRIIGLLYLFYNTGWHFELLKSFSA